MAKAKGKKNPHAHANPEYARAMQELRRSSAASRHTVKKYKGTRSQNRTRALADW